MTSSYGSGAYGAGTYGGGTMALPTPTISTAVAGYIPMANRRHIICPTMANYLSPTSAEITAGIDYTLAIASYSGFSGSGSNVDQPNVGSLWTPQIPGPISAADSSTTFNMAKSSVDVRSAFFDGSDGSNAQTACYYVVAYEGLTSTSKIKVFPVRVMSVAPSDDSGAAATLAISWSIYLPPSPFLATPTA